MDQVRIFDHDGIFTHQLRTSAERGYGLIKEMSAQFTLSVNDEKCRPDVLNYNNPVLIENSDGLLPFCGFIDGRGFRDGAAVINAYTPERIFAQRRGPQSLTLKGSAGEIFVQMIQYINAQEDTILEVGNIDSDSGYMEETLNPVTINYNLSRVVARSGECYRWRPEVVGGRLTIYCDWTPSFVIQSGLILHDGYNIAGEHPITESAPANDVLTYGNGNDWKTRKTANETDSESREQYGLRQYSNNVQTDSVDTLTLAAQVGLRMMKQPRNNFPLAALNIGDTFQKLQPGAIATITRLVGQAFSEDGLGFQSNSVIIQSMNYNPANGWVDLAIF
jgi:hypothetical protein